jgi:trans-2-enoyl-CoA reductase
LTGFGLASRISSAFGSDAATIVFLKTAQQEEQLHQVGTILLL